MTDDRRESVEPLDLNTVYRIVWTNPPQSVDFEPNAQRAVPPYLVSEERMRLQSGISVFRTLSQARRTTRARRPWMGRGFIAVIELPPTSEFRMERTTKSAGHYTLWADARSILEWVVGVFPVSTEEEQQDDL
jgi:hypothetical protein